MTLWMLQRTIVAEMTYEAGLSYEVHDGTARVFLHEGFATDKPPVENAESAPEVSAETEEKRGKSKRGGE